jgi:hypothetical protein
LSAPTSAVQTSLTSADLLLVGSGFSCSATDGTAPTSSTASTARPASWAYSATAANTAVRAAVRLGLDRGYGVLAMRNGFRGLRDGSI